MSLIKKFAIRRFCIGLSSEQLTCLVRQGDGYDAASTYCETISNPAGHWQPVLNILKNFRQKLPDVTRSLPVSIVLPSRWCRMMMVPWSDAMLKSEGAARFLRTQYIALYGDAANDWIITADDAPYGQPRLACAIERGLLDELQQIAMDGNKKPDSIEPIITAAWRNIARLAGADTKAFALVEADRLTFACCANGRIVAIDSHTCNDVKSSDIMQAWQRWCLRMPEYETVEQVVLVNLTGNGIDGSLPDLFKVVSASLHGLDSSCGFATFAGGK